MSPFLYGAWTDAARRHAASDAEQRNRDGTRAFWAERPDPEQVRREVAAVTDTPVRVLVGELDLMPGPELGAQLADLFPYGRCLVQSGAGHFPWVDDAALFTRLVVEALTD